MSDIKTLFFRDAAKFGGKPASDYVTKTGTQTLSRKTTTTNTTINSANIYTDGRFGPISIDGGTMTSGFIQHKLGTTITNSDITSGILTLPNEGCNIYRLSATEDISKINSIGVGTQVILEITNFCRFIHHATDLILPSEEDTYFWGGTIIHLYEYASEDWRITHIEYPNGEPEGIPDDYSRVDITCTNGTNIVIVSNDVICKTTNDLNNYHTISINYSSTITSSNLGSGESPIVDNTWYAIYIGTDATTGATKAVLRSMAIWPRGEPSTDFSYYALIGTVFHTTGGTFRKFAQRNKKVVYLEEAKIPGTNLTTNSWQSRDLTDYIPETIKSVTFYLADWGDVGWVGVSHASNGQYGSYGQGGNSGDFENFFNIFSGGLTDGFEFARTLTAYRINTLPYQTWYFFHRGFFNAADVVLGYEIE